MDDKEQADFGMIAMQSIRNDQRNQKICNKVGN